MPIAPYAPSQLSLSNFDATQAATATWVFSSSDSTVGQKSFEVKIFNNSTGAQVLDTGVINSAQTQYTIPAGTLVNRTVYKWQVQATDTNGVTSAWSTLQVFTCSSLPTPTINSPTSGQTIQGITLAVSANYAQAQGVLQQSFRIVIYSSDQTTIVKDTGTILSTSNQQTFFGLTSGNYYAQVTVTSTDGLSGLTAKTPFTINYSGGAQTPNITATADSATASIRLDWTNDRQIPGTYVATGGAPTYQTGIWGQAVDIHNYGEQVYWTFQQQSQFTYTSWFLPNVASSSFTTSQVLAHLRLDGQNLLQMRYDPSDSTFVFEKYANGNGIVAKSAAITFTAGEHIFIVIQQSSSSTVAYVGAGGTFYTINFGTQQDANATYGVGVYGVDTYTADDPGLVTIEYAYVGCTPADGNEANCLFDETHLTLDVLTESTLQGYYTNATQQTFTTSTVFLAEFDGNLVGGQTSATLASWNINRIADGVKTLIANIPYDSSLQTATYTDNTPLSGVQYTYEIDSVDTSGNIGNDPVVNCSVTFDGWWLSDPTTGTTFQFYYNVGDVSQKKTYQRTEYQTFGKFPIPAYGPGAYHSGKLTGWVIDTGSGQTAQQQYKTLEAMIDAHRQLVLRGDEGQGYVADVYDPTPTVKARNHKEYQEIEISWTEVAS